MLPANNIIPYCLHSQECYQHNYLIAVAVNVSCSVQSAKVLVLHKFLLKYKIAPNGTQM